MKPQSAIILTIAVADGIHRILYDKIETDEEVQYIVQGVCTDTLIYSSVIVLTEWLAQQPHTWCKVLAYTPTAALLATTIVYMIVAIKMIRTKKRLTRR
jgi:hypothetical protein